MPQCSGGVQKKKPETGTQNNAILSRTSACRRCYPSPTNEAATSRPDGHAPTPSRRASPFWLDAFGDYEDRTAGLGPVLSYTRKFGDTDFNFETQWLHEVETCNCTEGDYVRVEVLFKL